jgi:hypothetical protein
MDKQQMQINVRSFIRAQQSCKSDNLYDTSRFARDTDTFISRLRPKTCGGCTEKFDEFTLKEQLKIEVYEENSYLKFEIRCNGCSHLIASTKMSVNNKDYLHNLTLIEELARQAEDDCSIGYFECKGIIKFVKEMKEKAKEDNVMISTNLCGLEAVKRVHKHLEDNPFYKTSHLKLQINTLVHSVESCEACGVYVSADKIVDTDIKLVLSINFKDLLIEFKCEDCSETIMRLAVSKSMSADERMATNIFMRQLISLIKETFLCDVMPALRVMDEYCKINYINATPAVVQEEKPWTPMKAPAKPKPVAKTTEEKKKDFAKAIDNLIVGNPMIQRKETITNKNINGMSSENSKEENTMMNKMFGELTFGAVKGDMFKLSPLGVAFKSGEGRDAKYVAYDKANKELMDVDIVNFEANGMIMQLPVAMNAVEEGDIILHNSKPVIVERADNANKTLYVIEPGVAEVKGIKPVKNLFGFNFFTKVMPLINLGNMGASEDNPFGKMMPFMMMQSMSEGGNNGDMSSMMPLMMMSGAMGGEEMDMQSMMLPMMMMGSMGNQNGQGGDMMSQMLPFMMMSQGKDMDMTSMMPLMMMSGAMGGNNGGDNNMMQTMMMLSMFGGDSNPFGDMFGGKKKVVVTKEENDQE